MSGHTHTCARFILAPKCDSSFVLTRTQNESFRRLQPIRPFVSEFHRQVFFVLFFLRNPRAVKHYCPRVSSSECSPPGTEASGWLVCLAVGPSPATTSTWPQFSSVRGCNSPKVASQTIVYATAHHCQVKGKRRRINMERCCPLWFLVIFLAKTIIVF